MILVLLEVPLYTTRRSFLLERRRFRLCLDYVGIADSIFLHPSRTYKQKIGILFPIFPKREDRPLHIPTVYYREGFIYRPLFGYGEWRCRWGGGPR